MIHWQWLFAALFAGLVFGIFIVCLFTAGTESDLRMAIRNAFDLGHKLGTEGLNYKLSQKKFMERFGEL